MKFSYRSPRAHPNRLALRIETMKRNWLCAAGAASAGAGLIHLGVVQEHAAVSAWLGVAFAAAGVAQLGLSLRLVNRRPPAAAWLGAGLLFHLAVIGGWLLSRTAGLPLPGSGWVREGPGAMDIAATALEILSVVFIAKSLPFVTKRVAFRAIVASVATMAFALSGALGLRVALGEPLLAPTHSHHPHPDGSSDHSQIDQSPIEQGDHHD